jgi:4-amino-4-deoxy-L-arabinose transferase-like glycosyltransferase
VIANNILARPSANARAKERGNAPANLITLHTTAYAIHSFIVGHYARSIDRLAVIVKIDALAVMVKYPSRLVRENQLSMTSQPSGEITATPAQRIGWTILILITLYVCYFSHLGVIGFVGPDEPRYAWIARDMAETGDWVTPRLYGRPWFEKPPLLYWGGAIFFKLFGSRAPEVAARLPSAISALLATLALAWLAWRTYGKECARWLLLLLPTSVGMIGFSHAAATDMPFAGMLTTSMVCAAFALGLVVTTENTPILPRTPWLALTLFGLFLGLAVLAKGPAAIILSGGAVFFWAIFTKRWRDAFRLLHPAAIASFCLTALPWYILCARRNPDFFRVFIIEHNFKRYLTPEFQHVQPFWYYVPILLIALFPWTPSALFAARNILGDKTNSVSQSQSILVLCWVVWPLLFFSLSQSKLPGYVLPVVPPAILLCVQALFGGTQRTAACFRTFALTAGITFIIAAVAFLAFEKRIPSGQDIIPAPWHGSIWIPFLLGGIISIVIVWKKSAYASLVCCTTTLLLALAGLYGGLHWIDRQYSARQSVHGASVLYPIFDSSYAAVYQVPRGIQFGLNYYLRRETQDWSPSDVTAKWVFTSYQGTTALERQGFKCPHSIVFPAAFPCEKTPSSNRLGGRREPK